jgi:maltoporin
MRTLAKYSVLGFLVAWATGASAVDVEFNGYARAGVGLAAGGGGQVCFGLAGADTKYRLGNECDYVIEPQFTGRFVKLEDKSVWGIVAMPGLYRTYTNPNTATDTKYFSNLPAEWRQLYFFGENVPQLANGKIWGGRRYYDRLQTGINDQFLENEDGDGAGVEDMNLGFGKLSVAFLMNPNDESHAVPGANLAPYKLTTRLTGIQTVPDGALQIWAGYYGASVSDDVTDPAAPIQIDKPKSMFRVGAYHTLGNFLLGSNLVGAKVELGENHQLWRVVLQQGSTVPSIRTSFDFITEFRSVKNRADKNSDWVKSDWFTIGARSDTQISGPFRFLIEAGYDHVKPQDADAQSLIKVTGCLAVSAGNDAGSRPTFRLFYTQGIWNDAAKLSGGVYDHWQSGARLKQVYGDATSGGSFGIQAEAWF